MSAPCTSEQTLRWLLSHERCVCLAVLLAVSGDALERPELWEVAFGQQGVPCPAVYDDRRVCCVRRAPAVM